MTGKRDPQPVLDRFHRLFPDHPHAAFEQLVTLSDPSVLTQVCAEVADRWSAGGDPVLHARFLTMWSRATRAAARVDNDGTLVEGAVEQATLAVEAATVIRAEGAAQRVVRGRLVAESNLALAEAWRSVAWSRKVVRKGDIGALSARMVDSILERGLLQQGLDRTRQELLSPVEKALDLAEHAVDAGRKAAHRVTPAACSSAQGRAEHVMLMLRLALESSEIWRARANCGTCDKVRAAQEEVAILDRAQRRAAHVLWPPPVPQGRPGSRWSLAPDPDAPLSGVLSELPNQTARDLCEVVGQVLHRWAESLSESGHKSRALWLMHHAQAEDSHPDVVARAEIERHVNLWVAVARLERYLTAVGPSQTKRARKARAVLIGMLRQIPPTRALDYWTHWGQEEHGSRTTAPDHRPSSEPAKPDGAAPANGAVRDGGGGGRGSGTRPAASRRPASRAAYDLVKANLDGDVGRLVAVLCRLGAIVRTRWDDMDEEQRNQIRHATWFVSAWRLPRRAARVSPARSEIGDLFDDRLTAARYINQLALEFAEHYVPARVPAIALTLARLEARLAAPEGLRGTEEGFKMGASTGTGYELLLEAGARANALGSWCQAVSAYLSAARMALPSGLSTQIPAHPNTAVVERAEMALKHLRRGLAGHAPGSEQIDALREATVHAAHLAKTFALAGARAQAFAAADLAVGLPLRSMRLNSSQHRDEEDAHERHRLLAREVVMSTMLDTFESDDPRRPGLEAELRMIYGHRLKMRDSSLRLAGVVASQRSRAGGRRHPRGSLPSDVEAVLRDMPRGSAVVHFLHTRRNTCLAVGAKLVDGGPVRYEAWILDLTVAPSGDDTPVAPRLPLVVRNVLSELEAPDREQISLREAGELVWGPLVPWLRDVGRVCVIPHGRFAELPFHALIWPDPAGGAETRYAIDEKALYMAPSVQALARVRHRDARSNRVLLVGLDERIGAPSEVRQVKAHLTAASKKVRIPAEPPEAARALCNARKPNLLVHVAAHGRLREGGLTAALELGEDVAVSAEHLLNGGTSADLVFLNACGLGADTAGPGDLYGFAFALLASGTRTAILAQRPVVSQLAHAFADAFYARLARQPGEPVLDLFTQALREIRQSPEFSDPAFWSPYRLIGHPGALAWETEPPWAGAPGPRRAERPEEMAGAVLAGASAGMGSGVT